MSRNKYIWSLAFYQRQYPTFVSSGVASYVCHQYLAILYRKTENLVIFQPQLLSVDISTYSTYLAVFCKAVRDNWAAYVAGMPYLVAIVEMQQEFVVPTGVRVG